MIVPFQIENLTMDASRARQNLLDLVDKKAETLVKWFLSGWSKIFPRPCRRDWRDLDFDSYVIKRPVSFLPD